MKPTKTHATLTKSVASRNGCEEAAQNSIRIRRGGRVVAPKYDAEQTMDVIAFATATQHAIFVPIFALYAPTDYLHRN